MQGANLITKCLSLDNGINGGYVPQVRECCSKTDLSIIFGRLAGGVNMPKVMECCSKTSFPGTRKTVNMANTVNTIVLK